MQVEELLAMLQEKGLDDNAIKDLLKGALGALGEDFQEHDDKVAKEEGEEAEKAEAERILGVQL